MTKQPFFRPFLTGKIWKVDNLLSHFDGSYHYPNLQLSGFWIFWVG